MSDSVKVVGIIISGLVCFGFATIGVMEDKPVLLNFAYSFGGIFGVLLGIPIFGKINKAIKKLANDTETK